MVGVLMFYRSFQGTGRGERHDARVGAHRHARFLHEGL